MTTTAPPVIDLHGLVKRFGHTRALDGFDLRVEPGEVAGFLGPNGAGKSTTIRVLLGILRADEGTGSVLGLDPWSDAVELHHRLAYVPGDVSLWPNLSGGEILDMLAGLRSREAVRTEAYRTRRAELIERFQLDPTKRARSYSKGNRQKVALVAALAVEAELYLFDEPTSGLDPLMEAVFVDELRRLRRDGRSVLLSSHILGEVEKTCDTVTIIRAGKAVESGTLAALRHLTRTSVSARIAGDEAPISRIPSVGDLQREGDRIEFTLDNTGTTAVLRVLADLDAHEVVMQPPSLGELFLRHYDVPGADRTSAPAATEQTEAGHR